MVILDKGKRTATDLQARIAKIAVRPVPDPALDGQAYYQADKVSIFLYVLKHATLILVETRGVSKAHAEQLAKYALARIP